MRDGVRMMTPLFPALVLVEISDVIFAGRQHPGDLRDHHRPLSSCWTSNLFAILGLRARCIFLLADLGDRF